MENIYLILMILFIILALISVGAFVYFKIKETKIREVDTTYLKKIGKNYTKEELENALFNQYVNIIDARMEGNYIELKDMVADEEYNKILLEVKKEDEKKEKKIITDIRKDTCKLVNFYIANNQEVAELAVRYSSLEYVIYGMDTTDDSKKRVNHEYLLKFVKERTSNENMVCPSCSNRVNILLSSRCMYCGSPIVSKKGHWIYVDSRVSNLLRK